MVEYLHRLSGRLPAADTSERDISLDAFLATDKLPTRSSRVIKAVQIMSRFDHFQVAASRLLNVLTGGDYDEMFSSRAYKDSLKRGRPTLRNRVIDRLFFWEKDHCRLMYQWEKAAR